ncbi:hypothetical protein [Methylococcus sp. EFPC2]|uniref:hypothetical protein n=1 Tax=Methylococcus sp. EFPC2 TaxID=2812648 RepID=UPI001967877B|nr:hypothetical protein [Methylococcus sp. EFPC2]QSA98905.1 hypothetical protein JWZ97_09075 [Methylococcus sp. EFPC2]
MHFLLLILLSPFGVLLAVFGLVVLILAVSAVLEFPWIIPLGFGIGLLNRFLSRKISKPGIPCENEI